MPIVPSGSRQPLMPPYAWAPWQSGRYYFCPQCAAASTNGVLGNNSLRAMPFLIPNAVTLVRIGAEVTIVGDNGCTVRLGLYANDGANRPGALVVDAGTIAGDSATTQEITISVNLAAGVYYAASVIQGVTVTQPTMRTQSTLGVTTMEAGTTLPAAGSTWGSFTRTGVSGGLPDPFGSLSDSGTTPTRIFVKVA